MTAPGGHYAFGTGGNAQGCLAGGWSVPEDGYIWTTGPQSRMILPFAAGHGVLVMEIGLKPFIAPPLLPRQRLIVTCNGVPTAAEVLAGDATLGLVVPDAALAGATTLDIVLECPDAVAPAQVSESGDLRTLGFAVTELLLLWTEPRAPFAPRAMPPFPVEQDIIRGLTGLSIDALAMQFESLGRNCEFGLAQRQMGAEPLGLLRFSSVPPTRLLEALDRGFDGVETPATLTVYTKDESPRAEYLLRDATYGMNIHTDIGRDRATPAEILKIACRNLAFLRRKLAEDLAAAEKIFVFQNAGSASLSQALPLLNMLRSFGPNTLLYVTEGPPEQAGAVRQLDEDFLHGQVARLAPPEDVYDFDLPPWIAVCANAYRLWRLSGHGGA